MTEITYTLDSGIERNAANPDTYFIPPVDVKERLKAEDQVKLEQQYLELERIRTIKEVCDGYGYIENGNIICSNK